MILSVLKNSVLGLLFFATSAFAQDVLGDLRTSKQIVTWSESDVPNYSIQILATKTPPTDPTFVKKADLVYEYFSADGFVRYFCGSYSSFAEANKHLAEVRALGFDAAFVSNLKKISSKSSTSASSGVVTTGHKPIEIDPAKQYVVQVGAFRYPLYISFFEKVGTVYEYRLNDKIFRYTTQPVLGSEIEKELARVKNLGYNSAFIVEYDLYSPYKIE